MLQQQQNKVKAHLLYQLHLTFLMSLDTYILSFVRLLFVICICFLFFCVLLVVGAEMGDLEGFDLEGFDLITRYQLELYFHG